MTPTAVRALGLAVAAVVLSACSSGDEPTARRTPSGGDPTLAANTPTDLRHPCAAVPARAASDVLGGPVTTRRVVDQAAARTLRCRYRPEVRDGALAAEIRSAPDVTSLRRLVGLYVGTDRLQHHPADVPGADGAEVVLQPAAGLVTLFAKQGFVTHVVVVSTARVAEGERAAVALADLLVRAND